MERGGKTAPDLAAVEAIRLRAKWAVLSQAHIAIGGGCSCGAGATPVHVRDFEQDIIDHLAGKHADAALRSLIHDAQGSIATLLEALAQSGAEGEPQRRQLLADLARSIDSFDQLHSGH